MSYHPIKDLSLLWILTLATIAAIGVLAQQPDPYKELTEQHGAEMKEVIEHFEKTMLSVERHMDPRVIAQVAAGEYFDRLIEARCWDCERVQVATGVGVSRLLVLSYSPTSSRVQARVEYGWKMVSPHSRVALTRCHAQAFTTVYELARQNSVWKVIDEEAVNPDREDESPGLRARYCNPG